MANRFLKYCKRSFSHSRKKNTNIWARHAHVKTRRFRRNRCCKGAKLRGQFSPLPSFFTYHEINDRYLIVKDRIKALIKGSNHYIERIIFHCSMSEHLPLNNISTCKESRQLKNHFRSASGVTQRNGAMNFAIKLSVDASSSFSN